MNKINFQIHASNITRVGASQVVISFLEASANLNLQSIYPKTIHLVILNLSRED